MPTSQPSSPTPKDHEEFAFAFVNFTTQMLNLVGFRNDVLFALSAAKESLVERNTCMLGELRSFGQTGEVLRSLEASLGKSAFSTLAVLGSENAVKQASRRAEAATITFAHSLLDATLFSYCRLCFRVAPRDWFPFVRNRQVKAEDLMTVGPDASLEALAEGYVKALERESLVKKSDTLHALCRPPSNANYVCDYKFSKDQLEQFDSMRHDIVHGLRFRSSIPKAEVWLDFGLKTGFYFGAMLMKTYGLQPQACSEKLISWIQD